MEPSFNEAPLRPTSRFEGDVFSSPFICWLTLSSGRKELAHGDRSVCTLLARGGHDFMVEAQHERESAHRHVPAEFYASWSPQLEE